MAASTGISPIVTAHLLRKTDVCLLDLLSVLRPEEWDRATIAGRWRVRDVAAHLLDTALRKLSLVRDGCFFETPTIQGEADLKVLVNRLNHEGVTVYGRLSPPVLIAMLDMVTREFADFHESLDAFATAAFPVSWAGETSSLNWFDTARELTERWHHQQQIRLATDRPGIMTPELYHPVLDTFLRGLPHAFRNVEAREGSTLQVKISGNCGGLWQLRRKNCWQLEEPSDQAENRVTIPEDLAWRLFTKGLRPEEAASWIQIAGDPDLADAALRLTAIVG